MGIRKGSNVEKIIVIYGYVYSRIEEYRGDFMQQKIYNDYVEIEQKIAKLQVTQVMYNLAVPVQVIDQTITLSEAVKRLGGAGRGEKMWRSAAKGKKKSRIYDPDISRSKDDEYSIPTISKEECIAIAKEAAKFASAFRTAIAIGNTVEIDMKDLDPTLFEL